MLVVIPIAITVVMIYVIIMSFKAAQGKKRPNDREIIIPEQVDGLPDSTIKSNPLLDHNVNHNNHHSGSHHHGHHDHHNHSGVDDSHHHSDSHHSTHDGGGGSTDSWSGSDSSSSDFSSSPSIND